MKITTLVNKLLKTFVPLGVSSASFLVVLTNQPVSAFTINPVDPPGAINDYEPNKPYFIGGTSTWRIDLNPILVSPIDVAGKTAFKTYLDNSVFAKSQGWIFNIAKNDLAGSFDIVNYVACTPETICKANIGPAKQGVVGAFLDLTYNPGAGDPGLGFDPTTLNGIHWIQRIVNNHKLPGLPSLPDANHGVPDDRIDIIAGSTNPYYPIGSSNMSKGLFFDRPERRDVGREHKFSFETFLVQQTAPKTVTIYNGVTWGWKNTCTQLPVVPGSLSLFALADQSGSCQDFGDAPDSYQTLRASNGPLYQEGQLQYLGNLWDYENDGQPTYLANGDDINGGCNCGIDPDDEDGVVFGDNWVDVTFYITRPDPYPYQLRAWWDTNYNGSFEHPLELYIDDLLTLSPGIYTKRYELGFNPKANDLYSRFRLTWDPLDLDVKPYGEYYSKADCTIDDAAAENCTSHGEVEDYVHVPAPLPLLGVGAAFGYSRKLRKRIKTSKSPNLISAID